MIAVVGDGQLIVVAIVIVIAVVLRDIIGNLPIHAGIAGQARNADLPVVYAGGGFAVHAYILVVDQVNAFRILSLARIDVELQQIHIFFLCEVIMRRIRDGVVAPLLEEGEIRLLDQHGGAIFFGKDITFRRFFAEAHLILLVLGKSIEHVFRLIVADVVFLPQGRLKVHPIVPPLHLKLGRDRRAIDGMAVPPLHAGADGLRIVRVQQGEVLLLRICFGGHVLIAAGNRQGDGIRLIGIEAGEGIIGRHTIHGADLRHSARHLSPVLIDGHRRILRTMRGARRIANPPDRGAHAGLADIAEGSAQRGRVRHVQSFQGIVFHLRRGQPVAHARIYGVDVLPLAGKSFIRIRRHGHGSVILHIHRNPFAVCFIILLEHEVVRVLDSIVHPFHGDAEGLLQRFTRAARQHEHDAAVHVHQERLQILLFLCGEFHDQLRRRRRLRLRRGLGLLRGLRFRRRRAALRGLRLLRRRAALRCFRLLRRRAVLRRFRLFRRRAALRGLRLLRRRAVLRRFRLLRVLSLSGIQTRQSSGGRIKRKLLLDLCQRRDRLQAVAQRRK